MNLTYGDGAQSSLFQQNLVFKLIITVNHQHFSSNRIHLKKVWTLLYIIQLSLKFQQKVTFIIFHPISSFVNTEFTNQKRNF